MPNVLSSDKTTDHENKATADTNRQPQQKKTKASSTNLQAQQQKTSSADRKTQEEKRNTGKRSSRLERRYGRFHCKKCKRGWESAHVYVRPGTPKVVFKQHCKKCGLAWYPYVNEEFEKSDDTRPRHVDVKKPHPADLCGKCLAGYRCV